jgi:hypothetical protein
MKPLAAILLFAAACFAASATTQQPNSPAPSQADQQPPASLARVLSESAPPPAPSSIATVSVEGVSLSGPLSIENGLAFIGNNGAITASDKTVRVSLTRGGSLNVCASTQIHLSTDNTISGGGLMVALNSGALEGHYLPGQYSDVVLTPDLRILISGPGQADFSLRVNGQGDTCIDNHGDHAPYILASNLFEGGAYRVQPNKRVLFEHGNLQQVVDNEKESCGCPLPPPTPTPTTIVGLGAPGATLRSESQPTPPSPNSTAAQNPFPLAESEGLQPPPSPPSTPVVPAGEAAAQVTAPLVYNGETAQNVGMSASSVSGSAPSPPSPSTSPTTPAKAACNDPLFPGVVCDSPASATQAAPPAAAPAAEPPAKPKKKPNGFARFLRKIFGGD